MFTYIMMQMLPSEECKCIMFRLQQYITCVRYCGVIASRALDIEKAAIYIQTRLTSVGYKYVITYVHMSLSRIIC